MNDDMIELLALPKREFLKVCMRWIKEENDGKLMDVASTKCPLALWVAYNNAKCNKEMVANTAECPLCGHPMCPDCGNHCVEQLSRVTGYLSTVSGWNESKKQEFEDRTRYDLDSKTR